MPADFYISVNRAGEGWEAICPLLKLTVRDKKRDTAITILKQDCVLALRKMADEAMEYNSLLSDSNHEDEYDLSPEEMSDTDYNPGNACNAEQQQATRRYRRSNTEPSCVSPEMPDDVADIPGYSKHVLSRDGRVFQKKSGRMLTPNNHGGPNPYYMLRRDGAHLAAKISRVHLLDLVFPKASVISDSTPVS